ncbi:MAG: hypothetical protein WCS01_03255 [bacterium]
MRRSGKTRPVGPIIADPFAVIPIRPDDVVTRQDSRGNIHLRRTPRINGLRRRVADWLGYDYSRKIELDEHGTLYYGLVDGAHTLRAIADRIAAASGRDLKTVEEGVIVFTKRLMTLDMLALKVPKAAQWNNPQ